jgi:hypothetical protein
MFSAPPGSVVQTRRKQTRRAWSLTVAGTVVAAGFGVAAAKLVNGGLSVLHVVNPPSMPGGIVLFPLILVLPALWRWPRAGLVALLAGTTLIEQFQYTFGPAKGPVYKGPFNIPLFHSLSKGSFVTPAELLLFVLMVIWLMKGALQHSWQVPRSPLAKSIAAFLAIAVVIGFGLGLVHHGQMKVALWELRPWYCIGLVYLLTSSLFAGRNLLRPLAWTIVLGSGYKSLEGVYNYFVLARRMTPRPEAILGHEESFFFGVFLLATAALWLFQIRGRLRSVATALAPLVLIADLGNARRTGSLLLYVGLAALLAIAYFGMPERRHVLRRLIAVLAIGAAVYLPLYWNNGGTTGQPARAVHSAVAPDARDRSSNGYRDTENANLMFGIHSSRSIGKGFGVPIDNTYGNVDLTTVDSMIAYVPHNGVLYVWYRLGLLGEIALWTIVGFGILAGCKLAKQRDREAAALGAIVACAIICFILQGYNDLGFAYIRIVIFMGFALGALEATSRRFRDPRTPVRTTVDVSTGVPVAGAVNERAATADQRLRASH